MLPRGHDDPNNSPPKTPLITLDHVFDAVSGHRREILTLLAVYGPLNVADLATKMVLDETALSHQLNKLRACGLVTWTKHKKFHHYELTRLVPAFKCDGMVQMMIAAKTTDFLWWHYDEAGTTERCILPPDCFVDFQNDLRRSRQESNQSSHGRTEDHDTPPRPSVDEGRRAQDLRDGKSSHDPGGATPGAQST